MKKVLLDTNFLLLPFQLKLDVLKQVEELFDEPARFFVLDACLAEAKALQPKNFEKIKKVFSKAAVVKAAKKKPDDAVVGWASANDAVVATNDAELRRRLKNKGITIICLRNKSRLCLY